MSDAKETLKKQIVDCLALYGDEDAAAAMLSGMSLVANYLAKLDGHPTITPGFVLGIVCEVAAERGLAIERLKP